MGIMWWKNLKLCICSVNIAHWKEDIIVTINYVAVCVVVYKVTMYNITGLWVCKVDTLFLTMSFVITAEKLFWLLCRNFGRHKKLYFRCFGF
jgi:hypothetical protein